MTIRVMCYDCAQDAVVFHTLDLNKPKCLQHASEIRCACGHTAAVCPIAGCGDWQPVTPDAGQLLMFDFEFIISPTTLRH